MANRFEPKTPVSLAFPKDDPITVEELAKHDGSDPAKGIYVAIKVGALFDFFFFFPSFA